MKLVSFTTCPFVQRAVLMLREKSQDFDIEYIDLANKPEWFLKRSPRGKVPVVFVNDEDTLFESQAICEYLEETIPNPPLAPKTAVGRARDRAWFTFCSEELFTNSWRIESASSKEALDESVAKVNKAFRVIEEELGARPYLSASGAFGMADVGASSALFRAPVLKELGVDVMEGCPRVQAWSARVNARPSMARSVPETWRADFESSLQKYKSVLL